MEESPMKILPGIYPRVFGSGLLKIKSFINRLVSLLSVTEQDLLDAGVYLYRDLDE
jgi:hypothetical protein